MKEKKGKWWVDPASGWMYGFPKIYDADNDEDFQEWLVANGYPKKCVDIGYCRWWKAEEGDGSE